ncbi:MAG TPA: polysaccharide biosynthesis/export family protein [Chthoniobacteraceae bacterium]|nr:polysaccharide biosynthesis/export family protein [Chthoniobacteraceae bacterium]
MNAAASQFGAQPAPYAQPAQPAQAIGAPMGQQAPVGAYAPAAPAGYVPQAESALGAPDPNKPLGRGDIVSFSIAQDRDPAQTMRVTDTGELDFSFFPKIGRISVVGRTCAEVAAELKRKLEADYYNQADVTLGISQVNLAASRGRVYLSGMVRAPGPQDLPSNEHTTVCDAIIRAGGVAEFGDDKKIKVTRTGKDGKSTTYIVNYKAVVDGGHRDKDMELEDGDYINIPRKFINF